MCFFSQTWGDIRISFLEILYSTSSLQGSEGLPSLAFSPGSFQCQKAEASGGKGSGNCGFNFVSREL
jgi:hypothetical protein